MKRYLMLREYFRVLRRVKRMPNPDAYKKIEYLRFVMAHHCPECDDEVEERCYLCYRSEEGLIVERFVCASCGHDHTFPTESVH